jgi:hypothetical protein
MKRIPAEMEIAAVIVGFIQDLLERRRRARVERAVIQDNVRRYLARRHADRLRSQGGLLRMSASCGRSREYSPSGELIRERRYT